MGIIFSNVPPLRINGGEYNITDYINEKAEIVDSITIASGYVSKKSLFEIDRIVREHEKLKIKLVLGMYYVEGFPESIYNTAYSINESWKEDGIGEIRVVKSMKYHGKLYGFYKDGEMISAIVGSHNLGSIATEANNRRQYELSLFTTDKKECQSLSKHLNALSISPISTNISELDSVNIIHEENMKLRDVEGVTEISSADVEAYKRFETSIAFDIPLKVPGIPGETHDYMKSNINKCYAKGRLNTRTGVVTERGWWETEIIVGTSITNQPTYPEKDVPFYVITDDGWKFKAHASGDHKKNLESDGDLKILGYWIKGRLVAAGIVEPVDSPAADLENKDNNSADPYKRCKGVITYKKLVDYGRTSVKLIKTSERITDEEGTKLDVWILSFLPDSVK